MRIGIITWFTYENYGTKLQALALQGYLRNHGYSAELLNFEPPIVDTKKEKTSVKQKLINRKKFFDNQRAQKKYAKQIQKRSKVLKEVIEENCILTEKIANDEQYIKVANQFDLLICGSDQIWNPNWFHPYYFAGFKQINVPKIAYAPSIGVKEIKEEEKKKIQKCIKDFSAIAMREESGKSEIQKITQLNVQQVLDPTLLMDKSEWEKLLNITKDNEEGAYVCCYFLGDNKKHWNAVLNYALKNRMKIKIIPQQGSAYFKNGEVYADAGVKEFVSLIRSAKIIFTDSFHATVFSTIFHKDFYVFERFQETEKGSQNSRIYDFLRMIQMEKRLIKFNTDEIEVRTAIEYQNIDNILKNNINKSKKYLEEAIEINGKKM